LAVPYPARPGVSRRVDYGVVGSGLLGGSSFLGTELCQLENQSQGLVDRFGEEQLLLLADRDNDQVLDADVIAKAIGDADGIVGLHLRGRYALPLSPVDDVIVNIVCDLARTALYGKGTDVPEAVLDRDKAARALLKLMASGELVLTAAAASADEDLPGLDPEAVSDDPVMTFDTLKGF